MTTKTSPQLSFAKLETGMPMPHLLDIQTRAFQSLLQPDGKDGVRSDVGLERVFKDLFPIQDVNGNYSLEFVKYGLGEAKYTVEECIERDMTYSVPLKATLQLVVMEEVGEVTKTKRPKNIIEKEVYLGELPILTPLGTFVINGAERVIVSQLHRSPGVVFEESIHPNGQRLFSARSFLVRSFGASSAVFSPGSSMSSAMMAPMTSRTSMRDSRFLVRSRSRMSLTLSTTEGAGGVTARFGVVALAEIALVIALSRILPTVRLR